MSQQQISTTGSAGHAGAKPGPAHELKPEWVQQTFQVERLASALVTGNEAQPAGQVETEERMSIVLPAGSPIEAAREVLVEFVNGLG
jgi:hypothetical protein